MRAFILVPCLVAAAIVLQGCGGGGSPAPGGLPTQACVNSQIDIKSQSVTSTNKLTATGSEGPIKIKVSVDGTGTEKLDLEQMNLYENSVHTVSGTVNVMEGNHQMKVESKIILNVAKKIVVESTKVTNVTTGKVLFTNCTVKTIPQMPPVEHIVMAFKAIVLPMFQKQATCIGNDGAYDHYDVKANYEGPIPGQPSITNLNVQGSMEILLDKDYLMHSSTSKLKASATVTDVGNIDVDEQSDTTATKSKAGGPTPADLDWSSWGECTPLMMEDINDLFKPAKTSDITKKFNNKAFWKNQLLASIQGVLKATENTKLIV